MKVVVLEVPGLHLGHLSCCGAEWTATPTLDRLAAEGVVFDQHVADCPGAAIRSGWTGRYAFPPFAEQKEDLREGKHDLFALLEGHGVAARVLTVADAPGPPESNLSARWFSLLQESLAVLDTLEGRDQALLWVELPSLAPPWELPDEAWQRRFPDAEDEEDGRTPWPDPPAVTPADLDDEQVRRLQDTYGAVVEALDAVLGDWVAGLEEGGVLDHVAVWVTASTGLALGEHGIVGTSAPWPHEEVVHLPLLVRLPGAAEAGRRVAALTQPVDLFPTLLESFGLPVPAEAHGCSLWPLLRGEADQVRSYSCTALGQAGGAAYLLRTPEWAFLLPGSDRAPQLFVKPDDRWEVNDLAQLHQPWVEHLEATLRAFVAAAGRPGPLETPALRDREAVLANAGLV